MTNIEMLKFNTKYNITYNSSETYVVSWFDTFDTVRLSEQEFETVVKMLVNFSYDDFYDFSRMHEKCMFDITK
jgi:hypothetical protein